MRKTAISVIGGSKCGKKVERLAYKIGKIVAKVGATLICGGLSGVMDAACQGAKAEKAIVVGIIPGYDKKDANSYCDIVIPTGLGDARNILVVQSGDIIVALPGEYGTLSEIALALRYKKPIISLGSWNIPGVIQVKTLKEVEKKILELLKQQATLCNAGVSA